ncbi:MAG: hypothetical protein Q8O55_00710 [Dehalococcoidales bacterium]|nr:hypothetical protein [Dehalococcoidales bacterium]
MVKKNWYQSKQVWLGVVIVAGGIAEYIGGLPAGVSIPTAIAGCLSIIVRFLTNQPISGTPGAKPKE